MNTHRPIDLAPLLADLRRLAHLDAGDIPALLGALEEVRTSLWTQLLRPPAPAPRDATVDDELLTVPEIAAEVKFTRGYVYESVRRGDLVAVRKGKYVRVRRADLRAWLDGPSAPPLDARHSRPDSARHAATRRRSIPPTPAGARGIGPTPRSRERAEPDNLRAR